MTQYFHQSFTHTEMSPDPVTFAIFPVANAVAFTCIDSGYSATSYPKKIFQANATAIRRGSSVIPHDHYDQDLVIPHVPSSKTNGIIVK